MFKHYVINQTVQNLLCWGCLLMSQIKFWLYCTYEVSVSNIVKSVILFNYLFSLRRKITVLAFLSSLYHSLIMLDLLVSRWLKWQWTLEPTLSFIFSIISYASLCPVSFLYQNRWKHKISCLKATTLARVAASNAILFIDGTC